MKEGLEDGFIFLAGGPAPDRGPLLLQSFLLIFLHVDEDTHRQAGNKIEETHDGNDERERD